MQFHHNGFRPGDPDVHDPASGRAAGAPLPAEVDVLIVGCGPAGLTLAAQLAAFPEITTRIVEQKSGPLRLGQADGVACRTMELFQAFGFRERVEREAYWVNETAFWKPDPEDGGRIVRSGRIQDVEDGLAPYPHVILNQARVHDFYLDIMRNSPSRLVPDYGRRLAGLSVDEAAADDPDAYPVTVRLEPAEGEGPAQTLRARYVVGCDGARSAVRRSIGLALKGDAANVAWGVMDVLAITDFPDIRLKALIQSAGEGSIVLIPREGGHLARIYVELDKLAPDERVAARNITVDRLIAATSRILRPYHFEVREVAWWSVYEIGQRLADRFDEAAEESRRCPRVFIAGDACHTHSPKAGQGMNVSMQDAFNLGWKLAAVLRGHAGPALLRTYSDERQAIARELIDFDREWAAMLSAPLKTAPEGPGVDPAEVQDYFVRHGRYTAGTATRYASSMLTADAEHQALAAGFPLGMRFHGAPVIRLADAKPMLLNEVLDADGRWRVFLFAGRGDDGGAGSPMAALCAALESGLLRRFTPPGADVDSVIDVRAVFQQGHRDLALERMPGLLLPATGRLALRDYEKIFCPDLKAGADIFGLRGIDRAQGCIVVVRPDQYVATVLPLHAHAALEAFFAGFMRPASIDGPAGSSALASTPLTASLSG
jgi:phenol 2-monooxygenase (NADPH)